ncbi:hypothetical protein Z951_02695 [Streptomyces sp. PRh5]|uniref:hypothetical protein n=1 Tax=Streptomyces sp. PRh5 TaxID=1158056 RepID=UPI0004458F09|nr:hypothetical protein [Streptomyces sp. PRh5]EXU69484.1 hypothetical protein Z951_02695 [Streptomyces sp. PRh5]
MAMTGQGGSAATERRLGRAVLFLQQQAPMVTSNVVRADISTLLLTGQAMDFASRMHGFGRLTSAKAIRQFARLSGIPDSLLTLQVLPVLKQANVIDFSVDSDGAVKSIEEFVGVSGTVIQQTFRVLGHLKPSKEELALLHSVEIASWAPLTKTQHLDQIVTLGISDEAAARGFDLSLATSINQRVHSKDLNEDVIFNPHVWGTGQIQIASFLRNLPPGERDALLSICEQASARPGSTLDTVGGNSSIIRSARKVGLIQAGTVKSSASGTPLRQTYVFSPLIQTADDQSTTTEALHLRKLFLAHILFGREKAMLGKGRINDPVVLVSKLLNSGSVGPATNIGTDYHLLESHGVVRVEELANGRAFLKLIKEEIARDGLDWLKASVGNIPGGSSSLKMENVPGLFVSPESDRSKLADDGVSDEITTATILELRKEVQRAVRNETPFGR